MATPVVRYVPIRSAVEADARWGVLFGQSIAPLAGDFATTGDLVRDGREAARALTAAQAEGNRWRDYLCRWRANCRIRNMS